MNWKPATGKYASGEVLFLGKVPVASVSYDGISSRQAQPNRWKVSLSLPYFKSPAEQFAQIDEGKELAEDMVREWISLAGLQQL